IASVSMVLYIYGLRFVFLSYIDSTRWMLLIYILFVIGTGAMLYLVVLLRYQVLSDKDRKSTRLNSSHVSISYAVFCLNKKTMTEAHKIGEAGKIIEDGVREGKLGET